MTAKAKLTPDLEAQCLQLHIKGTSTPEIAAWLKTTHNITITKQALNQRFQRTRAVRAEYAKNAVRSVIVDRVTQDLDIIEQMQQAHGLLWLKATGAEKRAELKVIAQLIKLKMEHSGLGGNSQAQDPELMAEAESVLDRLEVLLDRNVLSAPPQGEGETLQDFTTVEFKRTDG